MAGCYLTELNPGEDEVLRITEVDTGFDSHARRVGESSTLKTSRTGVVPMQHKVLLAAHSRKKERKRGHT